MKIAIIIFLALTLSGCSGPAVNETLTDPVPTPNEPQVVLGDHQIHVEPETQNATVLVTVMLLRDATVSIDADGISMIRQDALIGENNWDVTVFEGSRKIRVLIDDGLSTQQETFLSVRLSQATLKVDYSGYPDATNQQEIIWFNLDGAYSADQYDDRDIEHPDYGTVHDFMVEWESQTGVQFTYDYSNGLGYSVSSIDGVGTPLSETAGSYWLYTINGESPDLGISAQELHSGDVVDWSFVSPV